MSDSSKPHTRWLLQLDDDLRISQTRARRTTIVAPEAIEEALAAAPAHRHPGATVWVFGYAADGQLVKTHLPTNTARLTGERAAACAWLSGCPCSDWKQFKVATSGAVR